MPIPSNDYVQQVTPSLLLDVADTLEEHDTYRPDSNLLRAAAVRIQQAEARAMAAEAAKTEFESPPPTDPPTSEELPVSKWIYVSCLVLAAMYLVLGLVRYDLPQTLHVEAPDAQPIKQTQSP